MTVASSGLRLTPADLRRRYLAEGMWTDATFGALLLDWLGRTPDLDFRVWSTTRGQRTTLGHVRDLALRLAAGLQRRGIGVGDRVCVYAPNSLEVALCLIAAPAIGATIVPIAPFYGLRELRYILEITQSRMLVTAEDRDGGRLGAVSAMRPALPMLESVFAIGEDIGTADPLADLFDADPIRELPAVDPDSEVLIAFTSGTTRSPKGVIHTHRSVCFDASEHFDQMNPRLSRPLLMGGPISNIAGLMAGFVLPLRRGLPVHIIDGWDSDLVLKAMRTCGLSAGWGAPVFLNSLFHNPATTPADLAQVEAVSLGGAHLPHAFIDRCRAEHIGVTRAYGSTEHPTVTSTNGPCPDEFRLTTDGTTLSGVEIHVVDEHGNACPSGIAGEILTRGPDLFAGYLDAAMNDDAFDADGWYHTGDIGTINAAGCLKVTDRLKDVIARNGVKISAMEVEEALLEMDGLLEAAVVSVPDDATGERAHAVLRVRPDLAGLQLGDLAAHLRRAGLARPKWPESFEIVNDFPRTPTGKIKKRELRDVVRHQLGVASKDEVDPSGD